MVSNLRFREAEANNVHLENIFKKDYKIQYKKKLSGKIKLYVSGKNALRGLSDVLSLYMRELH